MLNGDLGLPAGNDGNDVPTGWALTEFPVPDRDSATRIDFADHTTPTPDNRGIWLKPFEGNFPGFPDVLTVDADLTQTVVGAAGLRYDFRGWARFAGGYAGGVDVLVSPSPRAGQPPLTKTEFAIEFLDGGSSPISAAVLNLKANGQLNDNQWKQHLVSAIAPAGTAFVRVRASMIDGEFNADLAPGPGQSAFFDDFSLTAIPEPSTLAIALAALVCARRRRQ